MEKDNRSFCKLSMIKTRGLDDQNDGYFRKSTITAIIPASSTDSLIYLHATQAPIRVFHTVAEIMKRMSYE